MRKRKIILSIIGVSTLSFLDACLAITFPFNIQNNTQGTCTSNLVNGEIVNVTSKPLAVVSATISNPTILSGNIGTMNVTLEGWGGGSITFQYNVAQKGQPLSLLKVTYKTSDIYDPVIVEIPKSLSFHYDDQVGYILGCSS